MTHEASVVGVRDFGHTRDRVPRALSEEQLLGFAKGPIQNEMECNKAPGKGSSGSGTSQRFGKSEAGALAFLVPPTLGLCRFFGQEKKKLARLEGGQVREEAMSREGLLQAPRLHSVSFSGPRVRTRNESKPRNLVGTLRRRSLGYFRECCFSVSLALTAPSLCRGSSSRTSESASPNPVP